MEITLKFTFLVKNEKILAIDREHFVKNNDLDNFFSNENYTLKVFQCFGSDYIHDYTAYFSDAIKCIINDLKIEDSLLNKLLSNKFADLDKTSRQKELFIYFINKFFVLHLGDYDDSGYIKYFYGYYSASVGFKFDLPIDIVKRFVAPNVEILEHKPFSILIKELNNDEILTYVAPRYYYDLGWWDREFIRNDVNKIEKLTINWLEREKGTAHLD